ncbi:XRE family transcriptional regulator [Dickeya fangzhongdai]|uniref:helix-turn-helix domain-containing protein n=1 Tax=Dickeya fangzhongdai TaxID=1778540 RepID=UPI001367B329|nr:XRE family transcriptional regulator [Dickeya fangzhongdai]UMB79208.1 XRE family transcriptional regulator [Dickeya fangzhongdai]
MNTSQHHDKAETTSINIGNKIKQLRITRNISLNDLSRLSGVSKAALSKLESGHSNPRVDTLDAIASALRVPLSDLLAVNTSAYPYMEKSIPMQGEYAQKMKFRIGLGNIAEIWHLQMNPGVIINSPPHASGTHEHILVHSGSLMLKLADDESIVLKAGDFYCFSGNITHSYICTDSAVSATVVMSNAIQV